MKPILSPGYTRDDPKGIKEVPSRFSSKIRERSGFGFSGSNSGASGYFVLVL